VYPVQFVKDIYTLVMGSDHSAGGAADTKDNSGLYMALLK